MWFFVPVWMVPGFAAQNPRQEILLRQTEAVKIPEIYDSYRFRYPSAAARNELYRNGRPFFL